MFSIDIAQGWSSEQLWCWYGARRALTEAITALEEAGIALVPLIADTEWRADGVQALNETIEGFSGRCASETSALRPRLWELEAVS